ncbi:hypothetical protein RI129_000114 [Pyrocoelia pectoralis]|uniref:Uncharacterized protein n=1 Tax=Pyrocoelia pectoralis TaxID=417401 RepID=A0AAN7V385_9COLE
MLGNKLRSWMEAVRPKKKQQRKEKQLKSSLGNENTTTFTNSESLQSTRSSENNWDGMTQKSILSTTDKVARYSGANLSSPESAYSTGYSTDGTSPGAPPEYYINVKSVGYSFYSLSTNSVCYVVRAVRIVVCTYVCSAKNNGIHNSQLLSNGITSKYKEAVTNAGILSPRQRNRIRTNPWVPANNLSPGSSCVGLAHRPDCPKSPILKSSTSPRYCISKTTPILIKKASKSKQSLSSSSCSSLSTNASGNWDLSLARNNSNIGSDDDEDCTLNEMMGKYDESYVYEKETDILSDSDATDCETDIDTGQGSNGDPDSVQHELDFIDNGSYLEFNIDIKNAKNTGHCTYHNYEIQKKCSRRRISRRSIKQELQYQISGNKHTNERRRRSNSSKKKVRNVVEYAFNHPLQHTGSRSAGATPLSARRTSQPVSKVTTEDNLRRRSNSVTFNTSSVHVINQKDKEADKKYRELINEADRLLTSMKSNVLSPRRMPVPPNKRVELLRNAESSKSDAFIKTRLIDDTANLHLSRIPSNNFNSSRFSPVKTHISNFISNNSPVLMKKDMSESPLTNRKEIRYIPAKSTTSSTDEMLFPQAEVMLRKHTKYRKKPNKTIMQRQYNAGSSSSSDSDGGRNTNYCCPHSEPLKRKTYSDPCKIIGCSNNQIVCTKGSTNYSSSENLRQQVLLNTLANLKRNLESQSASLRRVYRSSNSIRM